MNNSMQWDNRKDFIFIVAKLLLMKRLQYIIFQNIYEKLNAFLRVW